MTNAHTVIRRVIENLPGVNAGAVTELIEERLRDAGYVIAYQSLCWCEGMNEGTEHTPGCPEIAREEAQ